MFHVKRTQSVMGTPLLRRVLTTRGRQGAVLVPLEVVHLADPCSVLLSPSSPPDERGLGNFLLLCATSWQWAPLLFTPRRACCLENLRTSGLMFHVKRSQNRSREMRLTSRMRGAWTLVAILSHGSTVSSSVVAVSSGTPSRCLGEMTIRAAGHLARTARQ
jgi:hypothetical protein